MLHCAILIWLTRTSEIREEIVGEYVNSLKDIVLVLSGKRYTAQIGRPITAPKAQRHVDFESGTADLRVGSIELRCDQLFESPDRMDFIGHQIYDPGGLERRFTGTQSVNRNGVVSWHYKVTTTYPGHNAFEKGLSRRTSSVGPHRTLRRLKSHGRDQVVFDGVILTRVKTNRVSEPLPR